eukprot:SAG11_NODE_867_length_6831_cov_5.720737_3_plen_38_part_00
MQEVEREVERVVNAETMEQTWAHGKYARPNYNDHDKI